MKLLSAFPGKTPQKVRVKVKYFPKNKSFMNFIGFVYNKARRPIILLAYILMRANFSF